MFDAEIVGGGGKFPFEKNFGLRKFSPKSPRQSPRQVQNKSKKKLDLENFHQFFFFAKSLKMSCLMDKLWKKKFPFEKKFLKEIFFDKIFLWEKIFVRKKNFCWGKIFVRKNFFIGKKFFQKNFFGKKIFFERIFFRKKIL